MILPTDTQRIMLFGFSLAREPDGDIVIAVFQLREDQVPLRRRAMKLAVYANIEWLPIIAADENEIVLGKARHCLQQHYNDQTDLGHVLGCVACKLRKTSVSCGDGRVGQGMEGKSAKGETIIFIAEQKQEMRRQEKIAHFLILSNVCPSDKPLPAAKINTHMNMSHRSKLLVTLLSGVIGCSVVAYAQQETPP